MEFEDPDLTWGQAMIAGATAGVSEHFWMFPVDTAKTRMQADPMLNQPRYRNALVGVWTIARTEGIRKLYRGLTAVATGAIPSHAVSFATFEYVKRKTGGNEPGHHLLTNAMGGAAATMAHDAVVTPVDVVKQRMQVHGSQFRNVIECARHVWKQEGIRAFYASYPTTVVMNIPFAAVNFATFEAVKTILAEHNDSGLKEQLIAGGSAGALAGLVSNPLDVIKTRQQLYEAKAWETRPSAREIVMDILQREGKQAFWKGTTARVLYYTPSAAICWATYETTKRLLKGEPLTLSSPSRAKSASSS